jgi:tRNA-dihydrouridine synthase C
MIGRGAIRNPWIFSQFRAHWAGEPLFIPRGRDVLQWIASLFEETAAFERRFSPAKHVAKMKKYLCFISQGVDADGRFEFLIRRVTDPAEFFSVCREFLDHSEPVASAPPVSSGVFCGFAELLHSA